MILVIGYFVYVYGSVLRRVEMFEENIIAIDTYKTNNTIIKIFNETIGRSPSTIELDTYNDKVSKWMQAKKIHSGDDLEKKLKEDISNIENFEEDEEEEEDNNDKHDENKVELFKEVMQAKRKIDSLVEVMSKQFQE